METSEIPETWHRIFKDRASEFHKAGCKNPLNRAQKFPNRNAGISKIEPQNFENLSSEILGVEVPKFPKRNADFPELNLQNSRFQNSRRGGTCAATRRFSSRGLAAQGGRFLARSSGTAKPPAGERPAKLELPKFALHAAAPRCGSCPDFQPQVQNRRFPEPLRQILQPFPLTLSLPAPQKLPGLNFTNLDFEVSVP